jgi:class 3 adenylate cyclase/pimeloyl-ACP methyl ester carboxylesterase
VIEQPQTQYAKSGDLSIAYQVIGDAGRGVDLVMVPGSLNTLQNFWQVPELRRFVDRLASFARVVLLDKRGTGLSDRLAPGVVPALEEGIDDVQAVLDAVGIDRFALMGVADGGPLAIVFAASAPERVQALVLHATAARVRWAPDYDWGLTDEAVEAWFALVREDWGTGVMAGPHGFGDELVGQYARMEMNLGTPRAAEAIMRAAFDTDVRDVLPTLTAPTLVHHGEVGWVWNELGLRYLADHIPGARYASSPHSLLPGIGIEIDGFTAMIEEFLTGATHVVDIDRVLKTVLFTDIVDSTKRATSLGDRRWKELLDEHDAAIRDSVVRFRGDVVNTTGDGFLAAFDGPARAIRCGREVVDVASRLGLEVRAGAHTGEVEVRGEDIAGIAVHIGARVGALAEPGEVLVTSTVRDLVAGSGIEFTDRGRHALKGVPGEWQLLAVQE